MKNALAYYSWVQLNTSVFPEKKLIQNSM